MVALLHPRGEPVAGGPVLAAARDEVDRLSAGLSRALLGASPEVIRAVASRAAHAEAVAARRRRKVGDRPTLDRSADDAVTAAVHGFREASGRQVAASRRRHRLLALGNLWAVSLFGVAFAMVSSGAQPTDQPVALAMAAAVVGPLLALVTGTLRCRATRRAASRARAEWVTALEATGLETMGQLNARRLAVAAWERRVQEASVTDDLARPQLRAWHRLAGPGIPPVDVDLVLRRLGRLRRAQLRLLAAMLDQLADDRRGAALSVVDLDLTAQEPASAGSGRAGSLSSVRTAD